MARLPGDEALAAIGKLEARFGPPPAAIVTPQSGRVTKKFGFCVRRMLANYEIMIEERAFGKIPLQT
jgi:hypothetical protein